MSRIAAGWSQASAAEALGVSRQTANKWWRRFQAEGPAGLADRPSRPRRRRTISQRRRRLILRWRRTRKLGPHRIAALTGIPRSTVYAVLRREGLNRLAWMDRPTGRLVRRYERSLPGELVHADVKKLGRIPEGGGHRAHGRQQRPARGRGLGYDFVHSVVDDHSRLAYSEVLPDEKGVTCAGFLRRAAAFLAEHHVRVQAVMTDNALAYRHSADFQAVLRELGARHLLTPIYTPRVNGKVERFNRTLLEEWAYVRTYSGNAERVRLLDEWLHLYNHHRAHPALGGRPPVSRVNNLTGNYS